MNTPVSFEISLLLKEKGFDKITNFSYNSVGMISSISNRNSDGLFISAPTIAEIVMWLYEKHGIWVSISLNQFSEPKDLQWMYSIVFTEDCTYSHSPEAYSSPTEAYSQAIEYTLKNLI